MKARARTLAVAFAVSVSAAGCTKEKSGSTTSDTAPVIILAPAQTSVLANGTNTVAISVTDTGGASVVVSTNRGTFDPSGLASVAVPGGSGIVTLRTCNGAVAGCAGIATITATSPGRSAFTTIDFDSLAAVCPTDCSADPGCAGQTCTFTGGGTGVCSSGTCSLSSVAPSGAKASGANFAITCSPRNIPALAEHNCGISLVDAPFTCVAILKDRFNDVLADATPVMFVSETAAVGQIVTTPAYDPTAGGDSQMGLGIAVQGFNTLGSGLPFDVDADTTAGEPSVVHGLDGCGVRTHNPRDGIVTIIAIADGEEAFWDVNGDGSYEVGEPFVDLGEPFVDQNDNGKYDVGEWFLDVDGNKAWTPPNGVWNASTKIWTQTVVVYTGEAATLDSGAKVLGTRFAGSDFFDACIATSVAAPFDVASAVTAATSESYVVVASDMNLNFLNAGTKYSVLRVPDDTPVELQYYGRDAYTDWLGFFYRYWPCDKNGVCASQCRATGAAAPCTMKPSISNFECGVAAPLAITGGSEPGAGAVEWRVDVPWTVYDGVGRISRGGAVLHGIIR